MSAAIVQLDASHHDELIAFLDAAFSHRGAESFRSLLPAIYQPTAASMAQHYAIRDANQLASVVGLYPIQWITPGGTLRIAGLGAVSTAPALRGRGHMRRLVAYVRDEARRHGYPLSWLGGQRQRYAYFGWEIAGCVHVFDVSRANVRHVLGDSAGGLTLRPARLDADELAAIRRLHDAQPFRCDRPMFAARLRHWHHVPIVGCMNERVMAYAVATEDGKAVWELSGQDDAAALSLVAAMLRRDEVHRLRLELANPSATLARRLNGLAESCAIKHGYNWQVFDWPTTLTTLLRAAVRSGGLMAGQVVIGVDDRSLQLTVGEDDATCRATEARPAVAADAMTWVRALFGPLPPSQVLDLPPAARMLDAWCPLPAALPRQDHV